MPWPSNRVLSELLALAGEQNDDRIKARALRRAARGALTWPIEVAALLESGRPLTALDRVGPWVAAQMMQLAEAAIPAEPPPLRRTFQTWTEAAAHASTFRETVRGDLQTHTVWSDGHSTALEMAQAARERGYEYLLVTDHSKGLPIANGLSEERFRQQRPELDAAADASGIRVLQGIEMNIGQAGEGDMEADALAELSLVLGAFHSALRRKEDQTERYLAALRNPWVDVLAHPRCRIFNFRIGLSADWPRVFAEAALLDKAVEVDGYADRQDLDVDLLELAADAGVRISLGSDSHHVVDLEYMTFAVGSVARAGIPAERVVNCMPADELVAWAAQHRRH